MPTRIAFRTHYPDRMKELAGKPTYFVEKIVKGLESSDIDTDVFVENAAWEGYVFDTDEYYDCYPKTTTIRSNYDYWKSKEGQLIQPFFWAGKPYRSKHVVFCPEVMLKRVRRVHIENPHIVIKSDGHNVLQHYMNNEVIKYFTQNEGFDDPDHFWMWFDQDFDGAYLELENVGG